jgi:hypothetical protein
MRACFAFQTKARKMTTQIQRRINAQRLNAMHRAQHDVRVANAIQTFRDTHDDAQIERVERFARFVRITYIVCEYNARCVVDICTM